MKIQILSTINKINITYDGINGRSKNKTFKGGDYEGILNFALSLPDRYIFMCSFDILDWAKKNKHDIIKKKCWEFC